MCQAFQKLWGRTGRKALKSPNRYLIEEALKLGTRVLVMEEGKATQFDPPSAVMASPATPFVAQLVRRSRDFAPRL